MHTQQDIDRSFNILKNDIKRHSKGGTSCEDVLQYLYENSNKIWFMAWETINQKTKTGKYLSHRAPARLTDLADQGLVVKKDIGRYVAYRLNFEQYKLIEARLGVKGGWKEAELPKRPKIEVKLVDGKPVAVEV